MALYIIDTHYYIKQLEATGFTNQQAETQIKIITEMLENHMATKQDLNELELRLTTELKLMRAELLGNDEKNRNELKNDIANLRTELKTDISNLRTELITHSNKMLFATVGLLGGLMTLFHFLH
jgi:hypothetical protein